MIERLPTFSDPSGMQDSSPDPDSEQKWEFRSGPIVTEQIVIDDVDDDHVFFRTMSGNDLGTMKRSELLESGEFVETVDLLDS